MQRQLDAIASRWWIQNWFFLPDATRVCLFLNFFFRLLAKRTQQCSLYLSAFNEGHMDALGIEAKGIKMQFTISHAFSCRPYYPSIYRYIVRSWEEEVDYKVLTTSTNRVISRLGQCGIFFQVFVQAQTVSILGISQQNSKWLGINFNEKHPQIMSVLPSNDFLKNIHCVRGAAPLWEDFFFANCIQVKIAPKSSKNCNES